MELLGRGDTLFAAKSGFNFFRVIKIPASKQVTPKKFETDCHSGGKLSPEIVPITIHIHISK